MHKRTFIKAVYTSQRTNNTWGSHSCYLLYRQSCRSSITLCKAELNFVFFFGLRPGSYLCNVLQPALLFPVPVKFTLIFCGKQAK
jgi:hypothetical protein